MLSVGIEAACFGSTAELLQSPHLDRAGCLVLDVRMPGPSGLDLQQHLAEAGIARPIVFLTGHGDIPMSVQAMRAGAVAIRMSTTRDSARPCGPWETPPRLTARRRRRLRPEVLNE